MPSRLAERNGGRVGLGLLAIILALGLALRVDYAWEGRAPVYDAAAYARIGANLDRGRGFTLGRGATQPASDYSPGLPLTVAAIYEAGGGVHERLARVLLALAGALAPLFTYLIGRRLAGPGAGLLGAAAIAVYPALLEYQGMLMGEPLATTLLSGSILAILRAGEESGRRRQTAWLLGGLLLGALILLRPEYIAVAVLLAVIVALRPSRRGRPGLADGALLLAGAALVVAPWTIRNAVALDRFVPVSTGGGQVLFAGAYMPSGGDPEAVGRTLLERHPRLVGELAAAHVPALARRPLPQARAAVLARVRLEQILAALAARRFPGMATDTALARMGRELLWRDVTEQPLSYLGFVAAKVGRIWAHGPRDVMRRPGWEALHWALVALGLLGLVVLAARRRWEALLLAAVFLCITAISAVLVASPRRVLVMLPLVAALGGVGAVWLTGRLRARPFAERVDSAG